MASRKRRADALLAERGFAASVKEAQALVLAGKVMISDTRGRERKLQKPGESLEEGVRFRLKGEPKPYVSRAGGKLEAALDHFGIDPKGRVALDLGLSTGGFTDCLLQRGVQRVHGVDVAYGIVDWRLRQDPRLVLYERTNARTVSLALLGERPDLVVIDLSFIGLSAIWPLLPPLLAPRSDVLALVKPQFELPREASTDGVIREEQDRRIALESARTAAESAGLTVRGWLSSPVAGREGNREWLLHATSGEVS